MTLRPLRQALPISIAVLTMVGLSACGVQDSKHNSSPEAVKITTPVVTFDPASRLTVAAALMTDLKAVTGRYETSDESVARARSGGTIIRLSVDEGDMVQAGQLIGIVSAPRIDAEIAARQAGARAAEASSRAVQGGSAAAQVDIARARAIAAQAPAALEQALAGQARAQADYDRTQSLFQQGVYAQARLDQMNAARRVANAQVAAAQAGVVASREVIRAAQAQAAVADANARAAQSQAGATRAQTGIAIAMQGEGRIISPRAGRVTSVPVTLGSVVMPGEIIATIAGGIPILKIMVPEAEAQNIRAGQSLSLLDQIGGVIGQAAVMKVYPAVLNGQVELDLIADGPEERFIGQRTSVLLPIGQRQAISVPLAYVRTTAGVDYAQLLRDGQVLEVPVQIGTAQQGRVEVLSGLVVGDVIVAYKVSTIIPSARP